jgi:hypothetical protein|tara:strand:- start:478 stop:693 length:216 start_codon:yes stop_codon:yes gene_type:complete
MKILEPSSITTTGTPVKCQSISIDSKEIAILFYGTREVDIITVPEAHIPIADFDEYLEKLGYNLSEILYMT